MVYGEGWRLVHKLLRKNDQQRSMQKAGAGFGASELGFRQNIINGFDFPLSVGWYRTIRGTKSGGFDDNAII